MLTEIDCANEYLLGLKSNTMTTLPQNRTIPIGWWRFQWPDSLRAYWATFEETRPSPGDIFGRLLSVEEIAAFIRGQDHPEFTEEQFALLSETVIRRGLERRSLSDADWDAIVKAAIEVVKNVVRRNYKEWQQQPTRYISDLAIELKEFRCYQALFRAIGHANPHYALLKSQAVRNEYSVDRDLKPFWDSLEAELA